MNIGHIKFQKHLPCGSWDHTCGWRDRHDHSRSSHANANTQGIGGQINIITTFNSNENLEAKTVVHTDPQKSPINVILTCGS